jgi:hypothetical protein
MWIQQRVSHQHQQSNPPPEYVHSALLAGDRIPTIRCAEKHALTGPPSTRQTKLTVDVDERVKRALVRWVVEDNRPHAIVETPAFERFYSVLARNKEPPLRREAIASRIAKLTDTLKDRLATELKQIECVAATTDGWHSPAAVEFICAVVHFINKKWELQYQCIGVQDLKGDSTAENVHAVLKSIFAIYDLHPPTVTCDQGRNFSNAVDLMAPDVCRVICAAHNINLCVGDIANENRTKHEHQTAEYPAPGTSCCRFRCRSIGAHFHRMLQTSIGMPSNG